MLTQENKQLLLIGQVTEKTGVPIRTIRYYESLGLIQPSARTEGGYRQFSTDVLTRLAFIKRAQHLGLSLEEIRDILAVYDHGQPPCCEIQEKLQEKLSQIDHQIEQLLTLRSEINQLLSGWQSIESQNNDSICPNIQNNYT